jgi:hypothetical protein
MLNALREKKVFQLFRVLFLTYYLHTYFQFYCFLYNNDTHVFKFD